MGKAGHFAAKAATSPDGMSYKTAADVSARWQHFATWAKEQDIKKMEDVSRELVIKYGKELASKVTNGKLTAASAQVYLSAVNSIMKLTPQNWRSVSPTKECGIPHKTGIRSVAPKAIDRASYQAARSAIEAKSERAAAIVALCRELGLRSREASQLDAKSALQQAEKEGKAYLFKGTKGDRPREIPISPNGLEALRQAARLQGEAANLMTEDRWKEWSQRELKQIRTLAAKETGAALHDLRAAYACERYQHLTGHLPKVAGGPGADREADLAARLQIAAELGHGRIEVSNSYLGAR
jgi:site-specific recombinase XerD